MAVTKIWISLYDIPAAERGEAEVIAQKAGRTLQRYLGKLAKAGAKFAGTKPTSASVGGSDLLLYLCVRSVIATEVEAGGWETQGGTGAGIGTGKTTSFAGYALSEVYWSSVKAFGTGQVQRAKVLANAAFHEFAHNKCAAVKTDFENFVHSNGGYGILGANPLRATLNSLEPNNENNKFVRLCIDKPMPQYIWYL